MMRLNHGFKYWESFTNLVFVYNSGIIYICILKLACCIISQTEPEFVEKPYAL